MLGEYNCRKYVCDNVAFDLILCSENKTGSRLFSFGMR